MEDCIKNIGQKARVGVKYCTDRERFAMLLQNTGILAFYTADKPLPDQNYSPKPSPCEERHREHGEL